jgi:hypothetical protein
MFSFRSAVETGEYRFTSLSPSKLPQGLTPAAKASLARLRDLYEAALPHSLIEDGIVTVAVKKQPPIDFLPIVDEARRVLDDGNQEFAPVDLSQISLPTEKAAIFAGKTTVTPSPKRRIRQPVAQVVRPEPHFDEESDEPDRGNFLAAQSHRQLPEEPAPPIPRPVRKEPVRPVKKPAKSPKPRPVAKPKAAKDAKPSRPTKGGKPAGRSRKRRAG